MCKPTANQSNVTSPEATVARRTDHLLAALVVAVGLLAVLQPALGGAADEGIDLMRQITSQWNHPNIMLVLDRSGSMGWPVVRSSSWDTSASSDGAYYMLQSFQYRESSSVSHIGFWLVAADYTFTYPNGGLYDSVNSVFPQTGGGQGYWLRVNRTLDKDYLQKTEVRSEVRGSIYNRYQSYIFCSTSGFSRGDFIEITYYQGHSELHGVYRVTDVNGGSGYIRVTRMNSDGNFLPEHFTFPTTGNNIVRLKEVRIGTTDYDEMEPREDAVDGMFENSTRRYLYVKGDQRWERGDLITVSGFTGGDASYNGGYILKSDPSESSDYPGYYRFQVARWDSDNTWSVRDSTYSFGASNDTSSLTLQRVTLPGKALSEPVWYYAPPSRMAIAKNVLGPHLAIYKPHTSLTPGTDARSKDFYTFSDDGPVAGSYYDWYHKVWVKWHPATATAAPVPDPAYSITESPGKLVRNFSDSVNWGLIAYSGSCTTQNILVEANPEDEEQAGVVDDIEDYLDTISTTYGIKPNGSTPTIAGLERAGEALVTGWVEGGARMKSTWDKDPRRDCNRPYGVILMTDGQSNNCNNNGRNSEWGSCPSSYTVYPAGASEDLWNLTRSGTRVNVRTWVIGVSPEVGACELNYTAYRGRTDRSSPNNDAGFDTEKDPRLPNGTYDSSEPYAFFTSSAEELKDAFVSIVAGMGEGDYATAPPSVNLKNQVTTGQIGMLASTEYPSWEGHLRAFDLGGGSAGGRLMWDAADVLVQGSDPDSPSPNNGYARQIFTWDPGSKYALVEVTADSAADLNAICGDCGVTKAVVDFIRGYNGKVDTDEHAMRPMLLGALVNSTPALISRPEEWKQNNLQSHAAYETDYATRHPLVWIGSSDGMVRAFDQIDGTEIICLIPPDLIKHQVTLYSNYVKSPGENPLGQTGMPADHQYGVANSLRFGDILVKGKYRTVMVVSEGPGGTGLHAVDVTHPYPGRKIANPHVDGETIDFVKDPNYDAKAPVEPMWSYTADGTAGTDILDGIGKTWSVPAMGALGFSDWMLLVGAGYHTNALNANPAKAFLLDPATGDPYTGKIDGSTLELDPESIFWVTNQAFSDAVLWQHDSTEFKQDNVITEGLLGDLNGRLWKITKSGKTVSASKFVDLPKPEPIYYAPAVAGYPDPTAEYSLYAFSSGSYFEINDSITGPDVGTTGHFAAKIYVGAKPLTGSLELVSVELGSLPDPDNPDSTLGRRTQVTAPPMIFTPADGSTESPVALYLVYDPDATACVGLSYIVKVEFDAKAWLALDDPSDYEPDVEVYKAGEGTAGGFAVAGDRVLVAQSAVGEGAAASLVPVPGLEMPVFARQNNVQYWIELQ